MPLPLRQLWVVPASVRFRVSYGIIDGAGERQVPASAELLPEATLGRQLFCFVCWQPVQLLANQRAGRAGKNMSCQHSFIGHACNCVAASRQHVDGSHRQQQTPIPHPEGKPVPPTSSPVLGSQRGVPKLRDTMTSRQRRFRTPITHSRAPTTSMTLASPSSNSSSAVSFSITAPRTAACSSLRAVSSSRSSASCYGSQQTEDVHAKLLRSIRCSTVAIGWR